MTIAFMIGCFLLLLFLGLPVAAALGIPSLIILLQIGVPLDMIILRLVTSLNSFTMMSAMFFILTANLMNAYGVAEKLFNLGEKSLGHLRGGLAHANIMASVIFAGMSGAAIADAAGLGAIEIREMTRRRYSKEFSVGITGASAIIGPIIPPSIPMVYYAVVSTSSVGKLFLAGIIPGLITAFTLGVAVVFVARRENVEKLKRATIKEWFFTFLDTVPAIITVVILLGGIFGGWFTPTEASVIAVIYTVALGIVYKKFSWKFFIGELFNSMKTMSKVMFIVACSSLFGQVVIRTQMASMLSDFMLTTFQSPVIILLLINLLLLVIGCFMEQVAAILVVTPILLPIMTALGISDVQCGLIIVFNLMIGLLTPPFGLVLFILAEVGQISIKQTVRGVAPYLLPLLVTLLIITFVPWVTEFMPALIFK
jgi:tripartite ATP-independent transporter DctM subunit